MGQDNVKLLHDKELVHGMKCTDGIIKQDCEACIKGKMTRKPFPKLGNNQERDVLELIHSDVCGPMPIKSLAGSMYFVTFIDDRSRFTAIYFLKKKSEVFQKFKNNIAWAENLTGKRVKILRSDNGGEYVSDEFQQFCNEHGIQRQFTIARTPEQNGVSERMNRTIMEAARSMLFHSKMPQRFWAEAVNTAVYLRNRSPTVAVKDKVPFELWYGKKPSVSHLRVFGCNAYVRIEKAGKLGAKAKRCRFVGYSSEKKGYRIYDIEKDIVITQRDIKFLEDQYGNPEKPNYIPDKLIYQFSPYFESEEELNERREHYENQDCDNLGHENDIDNVTDQDDANTSSAQTYEERFIRETQSLPPKRKRKSPDKLNLITTTEKTDGHFSESVLNDWWKWENVNQRVTYALLTEADYDEPKNIKEAWTGENSEHWKQATNSEYESLLKNDTWDLVEIPKNKNIVGCKWVFKIKRKGDGSIDRFKARLVAQGYTQEYGLDYQEIFSPVARYKSIRVMMAISNSLDLELHQLDVKTAFLNGKLDSEIYMSQPEGYTDESKPDHVCQLKKSLYGLKQAARVWNEAMDAHSKKAGYTQCSADCCIYVKRLENGKFVFLSLYVDDLLIVSNDISILKEEKESLKRAFEMEDQGEINFCLGMSVRRDRKNKRMFISQTSYLQNVLKKFGMENCKKMSTPLEFGKHFSLKGENESSADKRMFQSAVGSLVYAATATRPDLSASVGVLSKFMSNPSIDHWQGIKRIMRYIKGTLDYGIEFNASENDAIKLIGYSDADWAGDVVSRKSTSGFVFKLAGGAVSWQSKRQATIALSSTEAEYLALSSAVQEAVWLRQLLSDLGFQQESPTTINEDNQGVIALSKHPTSHSRTKHIDIRYHYIRQEINDKRIQVVYCSTDKMIADILTKGLGKPKFETCRDLLGVGQSN